MIRVLYVGSGFCSAKGLAGELPEALLAHHTGVEVDVVVPHLEGIDEGAGRLAERLTGCTAHVDGRDHQVKVYEGRRESHLRVFYMSADSLRHELNLTSDDGIRGCAVYAHAVCSWIKQSAVSYDVIHCDGLCTALIPTMMRKIYGGNARVDHAKTVVFATGIENKGNVDISWISRMGLPGELAGSEGMEFYGKMSILKGAYLFADAIAFPNDDIRSSIERNRGKDIGMEGVLFNRIDCIHSIGLGSAMKTRPEKDCAIEACYNVSDMSGKNRCKAALSQSLRLKKDRPMVAFIGKLDSESGIDLVNDILDDMMDRQVNLVIAGQGSDAYCSAVESWKNEFKGSVAWVNDTLTCELVRRILSASDILLMPSKHECLCRLHQKAMTYGCVVVARKQGCIVHDIHSVKDLDHVGAEDNGFTFDRYDSDEFFDAVMDALDVYGTSQWADVREHAMKTSFSMNETAKDCVRLYEALKG